MVSRPFGASQHRCPRAGEKFATPPDSGGVAPWAPGWLSAAGAFSAAYKALPFQTQGEKSAPKTTIFMKRKLVRRELGDPMAEANNQVAENKEVRQKRVRGGALRPKDVKNEGWPDYMHENTGSSDKMSIA